MPGPLIIILLPFVGATISLLLGSQPRAVRWMSAVVTAGTIGGVLIGFQERELHTFTLMLLFGVTALTAILGQQPFRDAPYCHAQTLLILGLGLGTLATSRPVADLLLLSLMGIVALTLWRTARRGDALSWGAVLCLVVGGLSLLGSLGVSGNAATILRFVASATLLPLFPLHAGFVGSLAGLPGTLPVMIAVIFPCLGWHGLVGIIQDLPTLLIQSVAPLALAGAVLGILRAPVQIHLGRILGSLTAVLLAVVWWHVATVGHDSSALWYVAAVTVVSSGLLLGAHLLEGRYGVSDVEKLGGLARPMPRFTFVVGLLFMAAMGMPFLGVFSAFITMMFTAAPSSSLSIGLVLVIWFVVSVLLLKLWHRLFYGRTRADFLYQDLSVAELLPFAVIIGLLLVGGRIADSRAPVVNQAQAPVVEAHR